MENKQAQTSQRKETL